MKTDLLRLHGPSVAGGIPGAVVWTMFPAWTLLVGLRRPR
ncbi:hypothetical protein H4W80_011761 [Nonomuraea angiospora]|uniref:Uncharacterized protein n=1 Tax=Nonomuraea angiospora TaxID=46172 RepID=A0ABR9MLZ1_9ACTN|nr:hypothetical protein [Nonomuraea angiospora]